MKKCLLIIVFLFLGMVLSGCDNLLSKDTEYRNISASQQDESAKATETLVSFFTYLNNQDFEKALTLFELDDVANSWEGLETFSLPEDREDKAKVLKNYCKATNTCLRAKVIEIEKEADGKYNLVVQFQNADGSTFVRGPCCGATEEEMPSQDIFEFEVKKINNVFKVMTAPIYIP